MAKSKFYEQIKSSLIEREVEDVYNKGINLYFPEVAITHPFACAGLIETKTNNHKILKLIIEYKLDELLKSSVGRAKVLVQVLDQLVHLIDALFLVIEILLEVVVKDGQVVASQGVELFIVGHLGVCPVAGM